MAWSSVLMRCSFATAVSFVAWGGCSLRNACMVGAWCVSLRDLAVLRVRELVCRFHRLLTFRALLCHHSTPGNNVLQHGNVLQHTEGRRCERTKRLARPFLDVCAASLQPKQTLPLETWPGYPTVRPSSTLGTRYTAVRKLYGQ